MQRSWARTFETIIAAGGFAARRRDDFLQTKREGDAVGFAAAAGPIAGQHRLDKADREATVAGPFADVRSRCLEAVTHGARTLLKALGRDSAAGHV